MTVVELQTPQQGLDVEQLAQQHHDEFGAGREFEREAVGHSCIHCIYDKERKHVNCWIAYDTLHEQPIGYLAACIRPSFYSKREYAVQEMWYVVPRFRGTKAALELLHKFEEWAIAKGVERIYTQVEHDTDTEAVKKTARLMNRLGYSVQGYIAVKVPTTNIEELNNDRSTHREVGAGQTTAQG